MALKSEEARGAKLSASKSALSYVRVYVHVNTYVLPCNIVTVRQIKRFSLNWCNSLLIEVSVQTGTSVPDNDTKLVIVVVLSSLTVSSLSVIQTGKSLVYTMTVHNKGNNADHI